MKDRVPLYPGRVKLAPVSGQENTYDMVRADEPTQEGTPLSKATFLKDATAALFGLGSDAVPDDVFGELSRFKSSLGNEYVWEKNAVHKTYDESTFTGDLLSGFNLRNGVVFYSNSFSINADGLFELTAPVSNTGEHTDYEFPEILNALNNDVYFVMVGAIGSVPEYVPSVTLYKKVAGTSFSHPGYRAVVVSNAKRYSNVRDELAIVGYVNSPDPNAYPIDDGYTYVPLGQFGEKSRIATGSYTGTGEYGAEHPNTLNFDFAPKLVIVIPGAAINTIWNTPLLMIRGCEASPVFYNNIGYSDPLKPQYNVVQWGETSVRWHGSMNTTLSDFAKLQYNWNGQPYFYIAIG